MCIRDSVSIVQGYGFGLLIEKHRGQKASKVFLTLSILVSLGLLGYFKYADFFLSSVNAVTGLSLPLLKLSLPIGISFYTFQVLSYVIDVYRGETAAQRNFIDLAAYVSLFPQLIAGPIVRYSDVAAELKSRTHSVSASAEGVRRFTIGFAKKLLLANQFGTCLLYTSRCSSITRARSASTPTSPSSSPRSTPRT